MSTDIQEFFARDPLKLTRSDIKEMIEAYRSARRAFNLGGKQAGATKKLTKKETEVDKISSTISLKDLGL